MAVKFISHVEENEDGKWFIELTDTLGEETKVCNDLDEYKKCLEQMAEDYGNEIEVVWTKSKTLSPANYQDLNDKMAELQKEYEKEISELENKNQQNDNDGFNPNE